MQWKSPTFALRFGHHRDLHAEWMSHNFALHFGRQRGLQAEWTSHNFAPHFGRIGRLRAERMSRDSALWHLAAGGCGNNLSQDLFSGTLVPVAGMASGRRLVRWPQRERSFFRLTRWLQSRGLLRDAWEKPDFLHDAHAGGELWRRSKESRSGCSGRGLSCGFRAELHGQRRPREGRPRVSTGSE